LDFFYLDTFKISQANQRFDIFVNNILVIRLIGSELNMGNNRGVTDNLIPFDFNLGNEVLAYTRGNKKKREDKNKKYL
ncbi:MAG: hypothetical protein ONB05_12560, partial [candidate division KSB1 bacterium]|nr:hypothetical protein [candidate division KSB1 bacterium]